MSRDLAIKTPASLNVLYFYNVNAFPMLTIDTHFVINAYECLNGCVNPKMLLIDYVKTPVLHTLYVTLLLKSVNSSLACFSLYI